MKSPEDDVSKRPSGAAKAGDDIAAMEAELIAAVAELGVHDATTDEIEHAMGRLYLSGDFTEEWFFRATADLIMKHRVATIMDGLVSVDADVAAETAPQDMITIVIDESNIVSDAVIKVAPMQKRISDPGYIRVGMRLESMPLSVRSQALLTWQYCPRLRRKPLRDLITDAVNSGHEIRNVPVIILNDGRLIAIKVA